MADWPYSTSRWQKLRKLKLSHQPLCQACSLTTRPVPATHVDHVKAIKAGGDPFPSLDGLMSFCAGCHSVKTNAMDNPHAFGGLKAQVIFRGCDENGFPIDQNHAYHQTGGDQDHEKSTSAGPAGEAHKELSKGNQD